MAEVSKTETRTERKALTIERLKELLHYDPDTGEFTRKVGVRGFAAGAKAGSPVKVGASAGYIYIVIDQEKYRAHRLAWLYMTGEWPTEVDHSNGCRADNRWSNLREATRSQNNANMKRRVDNQSGIKGVCQHGARWRAYVTVNGKQRHLGRFDSLEAAAQVRDVAAKSLFGEFARS